MDVSEKIMEQFHYFNIKCGVDSVYGNWAVSEEGDVVNSLYPYAILSIHLQDEDWIKKLSSKVWFRANCVDDLAKALDRACSILEATK